MGTYGLKPAFQRALQPMVGWLARRAVPADVVTLLGVGFACLGGVGFALSSRDVAWLALVPVAAALRTAANAIDGQLARSTATVRPMGEVFNEVGDRVGDIAVLAPMVLVPGVPPGPVMAGLVASLLSSYIGLASAAAGGARVYVGIMAKPDRMLVIGVGAGLAAVVGPGPLVVAVWLVVVGALITSAQRWMWIRRRLEGADA